MAGKITPNWEVIIVAEKIKVLGNCVKEGEEKISDIECCPDLILIDQRYRTKCGDGLCNSPENEENCPLDCTGSYQPITVKIFIDRESFNINEKTFNGQSQLEGKKLKIITTTSTQFYRVADTEEKKEYFTFFEFYSLLKNWSGPAWPLR